jgi:perosamine synthetase
MSSAELNEGDVESVVDVIRSGRLALGPVTREFEAKIADYVGVDYAVAVNSGTSALHLLVRSLDIGPGVGADSAPEVLVPSFTFAASVNAILFEGATPVFVDVEPETYNLDPEDVARKVKPQTKAIMAVDIFGHPAEWDRLMQIARQHDLHIIDDSCEALGAEYKGRKIGTFGDAAAFAFYPNKQMTTGEGGIIVTDNEEIARLCRSMRNQGRSEMGAWLEHVRLGYNYRMTEMSAALGVSQLQRLASFLEKRAHVARIYTERLADLDWVRTPVVKPHVRMSWFVYVITLVEDLQRDPVMAALAEQGIPSRGYFAPIHTQSYIRERFGDLAGTLPVTESIAQRTIALPFHNNLNEAQVARVVAALRDAV